MEEEPYITNKIHLDVNYDDPTQFIGRSVENGLPVTKPLDNLEELLAWKSNDSHDKGQSFSIASAPYHGKDRPDASPKTLVCHDMGGGYLNDRCEAIFSSDSAWKLVADALVHIAKYYKFEGWLLNIENDIEPENVGRLKNFVQYLTNEMHCAIASSQIIWYDSVTVEGVILRQNELNVKNRYSLSAAIFAPSWVKEVLGSKEFEINQAKFWKSLAPYCKYHVINIPYPRFYADFHPGIDVFGNLRYLHLSRQSLFPLMSSSALQPITVESQPHKVILSKCRGQVFLKARLRAGDWYQEAVEVYFPVTDPSKTSAEFTIKCQKRKKLAKPTYSHENQSHRFRVDPCMVEDFRCTMLDNKVEFREFLVQEYPRTYTMDFVFVPWKKFADMRLDDVNWAKSDDGADLLFSSTLRLEGIDESLPVTVFFRSGDKSKFKQLGIAYCDKYRIHNLHLPNPVRHGPGGEFEIVALQECPSTPSWLNDYLWEEIGTRYGRGMGGKLVVTYGEKTAGSVPADHVKRC